MKSVVWVQTEKLLSNDNLRLCLCHCLETGIQIQDVPMLQLLRMFNKAITLNKNLTGIFKAKIKTTGGPLSPLKHNALYKEK